MKLNIDCIKDILTKTEDVTDFVQKFFYESKKVNELFPGYTHDEIIYHINQASESGSLVKYIICQHHYFVKQKPAPAPTGTGKR